MSLSINIGRPFLNDKTLDEQARSVLRLYGTDAHVYLPGANGVAVSGLPTNNYTLSDGSTGYSAVDGTAGLVLDAAGSVGAELVTNGDFSNGTTGWSGIKLATVSNPAGQLVVTQGGDVNGGASSQITLVIGSTYRLSFSLNANAGAADLFAFVSSNSTGTIDRSLTFDCANTAGPYTVTFKAITTSSYIVISAGGGGFDAGESFAIDNISIREVTGIHATQATTANKPAVRRGLYNLLLNSATPATQSVTCAASPYTLALYGTGSVTLSGTGSGTLNGTGASDLVVLNFTPTAGSVTFTKSGTVSSFGLFQGTLTAAQILSEGGIPLTLASAASNPSAGRYSWQFDGTNDSLALGSVPFQMADDHCVIAGFRADAMGKVVVIPGSNVTGHRIAAVMTEGATGKARVSWWDGTNHNAIDSGSSVVGSTIVVAGRKVSSALVARLNGSQFGTATATATFVPDRAYIGTSDGGAYAHSGAIGPVIVIKGTISDADLLTLERWVASQTPAAPSF